MKTTVNTIFQTSANTIFTISGLILGILLFAHGAQTMTGWIGGEGFTSTMHYFTETVELTYTMALLVMSLQFFGALFILIGLTIRVVGLGMLGMFIGMIATVHYEHGFLMNWFGTSTGEGYEYHILVIGISSALLVLGGGAWSVGRKVASVIIR